MKASSIRVGIVLAVLFSTFQLQAQSGSNPIEDALLRWYPANQVTQFATCNNPEGLAFDGAHMWVACSGSSQLQEFNVSDGSRARSVSLAAAPTNLLYDGANVWVSSSSAGTLTKVNASTGAKAGTFTVGTTPLGMTFDGTYVYVANSGSNSVSQVTNSGTVTATFNLTAINPTCVVPLSMAYDYVHSSIWVACNAGSVGPVLAELNPSTGGLLAYTMLPTSPYANQIAFDGANIWVPVRTSSIVEEISTASATVVATVTLGGTSPVATAFDTTYIWVADNANDKVIKVQQSTGAVVGPPSGFATGSTSPYGIAFDGGNIWVSNANGSGGGNYSVSKM